MKSILIAAALVVSISSCKKDRCETCQITYITGVVKDPQMKCGTKDERENWKKELQFTGYTPSKCEVKK